ncbi:methyltransferase domain-containing protein [candidate division WOR-3 bacterium]|uniref:Methyltransferase domain-containing protein n=1 Tax=candidate division WOR-3 bacterium TaxID=2052148 RepID=A0A9D5QE19_UNCW3|nr:methyltransferase domain-containing protein [candidate division WOR-3 bacterium]MBD3364620.1 methyltransferase domain-containing protein [candidate division WOR-3 bacterium]
MRKLTQAEFWNREAEDFDAIYTRKKNKFLIYVDKIFRWAIYRRFEDVLAYSEPIKPKTFLDVGCGTGLYSLELARKGAVKVTGLDISKRMIELCIYRTRKEGLGKNTEFLNVDIKHFESKERFDIGIGMGLFDYIAEPLPVLYKFREYIKGSIFLSFPIRWHWKTPPRIIRMGLKRCPVFFYTSRQVRRLLTEAGFSKIRIRPMGPMYFVIAA